MKAHPGKKPEQEEEKAQGAAAYLDRDEYREALEEVARFLSFVFFRLEELKADLAVEGSHKQWADAQGPVVMLDEIDYARSDDPILREVDALHAQLKLVLDRLPIGPTGELRPQLHGPH